MMKVLSVNVSEKKGTVKHPVEKIKLNDKGIAGDAHSGNWHRQISLLSKETIDEFSEKTGTAFAPGEFAENIITEGIDFTTLALFDRVRINDALLEITQFGKKCHGDDCAVFRKTGKCVMPKEGIFCRVLEGGTVKKDDEISIIENHLEIAVVTLSDRAHDGEYYDESGPEITRLLQSHFAASRFSIKTENILLPDDSKRLEATLKDRMGRGADIIFTTGGTGLSPKDITPEVVLPMLDKVIPGVMEHIRVKYGEQFPSALLSRSIAGASGQTLIFTLPGSVKAVREYISEISKTLNHAILSIKGVESH